jgi:hypothetical protein
MSEKSSFGPDKQGFSTCQTPFAFLVFAQYLYAKTGSYFFAFSGQWKGGNPSPTTKKFYSREKNIFDIFSSKILNKLPPCTKASPAYLLTPQ